MDENGLNKEAFVGLGTDGEAKMVGVSNGLQARLKRNYPNIIHVKCTPHQCDLNAKDANAAFPCEVFRMVTDAYNWFCHSSIRQSEHQEVLKKTGFDSIETLLQLEEGEIVVQADNDLRAPMRLISPSTTRWLVFADCVERILPQVCHYF